MNIKDNRESDIVTSAHTTVGEVYVLLGATNFVPYMRINSTSAPKFVNLASGCLADLSNGTQLVWLPDAKLLATKD